MGVSINPAAALQKLLDIYGAKYNKPANYGGFPNRLSLIMDTLKFSDSEQKQVVTAYYSDDDSE